ncbi:GNAT family N-acetyltransferase [Litorivita sp. NS0012-18]|uniref:GNAT family N-acetyltransferase n=1 Tax=Litorivita sp. NS0012-18 TaxID=3127655 RepID=UPI003107DA66
MIEIEWHPARRCAMPPGAAMPPLQQHPAYAAAMARGIGHGAEDIRAALIRENGAVIGRAQVMLRHFPLAGMVGYMPRGPVWCSAPARETAIAALRAMPRSLRSEGTACRLWICNAEGDAPAAALSRIGYLPVITPQHVAEIDLDEDQDRRLARQSGKWRNRLRHAQGRELHITHRPLSTARDGWLLAAETVQQGAKGYRALPVSFAAHYPTDLTRLFLAERKGEVIAAMLVLRHGAAASYHIGWSSSAGKSASAHNLLLWQASNWLARKGVRRFDLGTLDTQAAAGLARFKLGAGARPRALGPTMLYSPPSGVLGRIRAHLKHAA